MFNWNFQVALFWQCISYSVRKEQWELKGERILLQGIVLECCLNSTSQKRFNYTKVCNDTYNMNLSQWINEYIGTIIHSLIPEKLSKHSMPSWFWICKQWLILIKNVLYMVWGTSTLITIRGNTTCVFQAPALHLVTSWWQLNLWFLLRNWVPSKYLPCDLNLLPHCKFVTHTQSWTLKTSALLLPWCSFHGRSWKSSSG